MLDWVKLSIGNTGISWWRSQSDGNPSYGNTRISENEVYVDGETGG